MSPEPQACIVPAKVRNGLWRCAGDFSALRNAVTGSHALIETASSLDGFAGKHSRHHISLDHGASSRSSGSTINSSPIAFSPSL